MSLGKIGNNLLGYYKFEGLAGSGVTYDSSENGRTLTNVNGVFVTTGKVGDGAGFTNANERYLESSDAAFNFDGSKDWTIIGWAEVDSLSPAGSDQILWGKYDDDGGSNDRQYICFFDASEDRFRALISQDGATNSADVSPTNTISANTFYMLTMEWDSAAQALSLQINNGTGGNIASGVAASQVINQSAAPFQIGNSQTTTNDAFLDGTVDELMIWDRLLTDAEKTALYNGGAGINLLPILNPAPFDHGDASGFFSDTVQGKLRPTAQIIQWKSDAPDPSGRRHVESGSYRKTAHLTNVGGFTAQRESGVALDFGNRQIPGGGSGFTTTTVPITFNMGELNSHPASRFDQLFQNGSGTGSEDLTAFNFRMWVGNLSAFAAVAYSGAQKTPVQVNPVFYYRESAQWRRRYELELLEPSGGSGVPVPVSGVSIMPSGMPDCPNVFTREDDITASGAYLDREFTNFVYIRGFFPDLPSGVFYKLGTYGGLGLGTFTTKFSYDYTRLDSNIIDPTDTKDFALSVEKGNPPQTLGDGSGWWQMNEASPKLSRVSGFTEAEFPFAETVMTLDQFVEGGGSVGRHTGIVSSGTGSGWAMNLRSNRADQVYTTSTAARTMDFAGDHSDGNVGFTFTGWIALNDPSGVDPAATGIFARPPSLDTGIMCRWNSRFSSSARQFRAWYNRLTGRFNWQCRTKDFRSVWQPYNYMHVDDQDNGQGEWDSAGLIEGNGGGVIRHRWYFLAFGYDPNGDASAGGDMFFRVNDGPIDRQSFCSEQLSLADMDGSTARAPFSIGSSFTRTAGNGSINPGAGQYDNWTLHRRALTNREMLDLYNQGFGQEYPVGRDRILNFDLPPEQAIIDVDPDPVPLRRALRAFYNFSDSSGVLQVADSQRYSNLFPSNAQKTAAAISGQFMPTSGIIVDEMPNFADLPTASGALQIRKDGGVGFEDGQIGNNVWWQAFSPSQLAAIGDCEFTIAAWARFPTAGSNDCIAGQWSAAGNNRYWLLRKGSGDDMAFSRANGTTIGQPATITTPPDFSAAFVPGRWYFVFVTSEATGGVGSSELTWSLNVHDPILSQTFTSTQVSTFQWGDMNQSVPITFGAYETIGTAIVGDIDLAAFGMWRRKLTSSEISTLINGGNGLNFGAANFGRITRNYWDSQKKRDGDPSTI